MRKIVQAAVLLAPLSACALGSPPPSASLPGDVITGGTDPMRAAILGSAYSFNRQSTPAERMRAAALVEYLAANYNWDHRWVEYTPTTGPALLASRAELHRAFGIAPDAPPQLVVDGLMDTSRTLSRGAQPVLPANVFSEPRMTLAQLTTPSDLPATRVATGMMERELLRIDADRYNGGPGGSGGGGGGAHP
ncbi:hypothetical protein [Roseococcus sp. YIM B11640]|uniref:hypothetical protein n=1 Tax=Roseococcus sp. YIM B11640 TaxID=3133973 RepID=UPI003C7D9918